MSEYTPVSIVTVTYQRITNSAINRYPNGPKCATCAGLEFQQGCCCCDGSYSMHREAV